MDHSHYAKFLSHLPVFSNLSDEEIGEIVRLFKPATMKAGEILVSEGDTSQSMLIIESGQVAVVKTTHQGDEKVLAILDAPTVIGELSLLDGIKRSATVRCAKDGQAWRIERADFEVLRQNFHPAAFKVLHNLGLMMAERLRSTNARISEFFSQPGDSLELMQKRQKELWEQRLKERGDM
ncbi:MAG: cyclic nucleotide-binding domain-containing protein [Deltaproteobacteria bacterium]|jgi:CRP/FNR family transcriptional regulator, cyclic AMP receptor protein|nr:cyclic nucleotide-binding domain-containing protein [Deltaproteobacteria bacterium]MBT6492210.1 cyclic nucleotide-binding domain-containing protein [Deltaproteobacteria bacterium]